MPKKIGSLFNYLRAVYTKYITLPPLLRDILAACNLKPNYSLLGRELGYDRCTIKSHYENRTLDPHRHKPSMIDTFYDIIETLLSDDTPQ